MNVLEPAQGYSFIFCHPKGGGCMRQAHILRKISYLTVMVVLLCTASRVQAFSFQERVSTAKGLAHYAMGHIYDLLGHPANAVVEYERAVYFDEASYLGYLRLGADYARLDKLDESVSALHRVLIFNPEDLQSRYLLALIFSSQKKYQKAADQYELILKNFSSIEPENVEIYTYLGQLYYSQKKYDKAIEQLERVLAVQTENTDILYLLGSLYLEVGKQERSMVLLKQSIALDPQHKDSLNALGYLYVEKGDHLDEAVDLIERALAGDPNNGAYLDSLGWAHYKRGEYEEALEVLKQAESMMQDPLIFEHLGDAYLKLKEVDKAVLSWERSLELLPEQDSIVEKINNLRQTQASHLE